MKQFFFSLFFLFAFCSISRSQEEIKLNTYITTEYNGKTEKHISDDFLVDVSNPRMYFYPSAKEKNTGTAVVICPGGGYGGLSVIKEGEEIAKWFNEIGVNAFVLYYRMPYGHSEFPLHDAQSALIIIENRAKEWNINKKKIGIIGFSAGGHLALTVGTHFKTKAERPAFIILGYPVVTMDKEITHIGSRDNLLGENPSPEIIKLYSSELQITKKTPPAFIVHAIDDDIVPIANSERLMKALQEKKVPAEFNKFDVGGHGFGMRKRDIPVDSWPELLKTWMKKRGLIPD